MKLLHRGFIYESISTDELEAEYQKFLRGEPFKMTNDLIAYAGTRSSRQEETSSSDYLDVEDELSGNTETDVPSILSKWNIKFEEVNGDYVYAEDGDYYIVRGREVVPVNKLIENPSNYHAEFPEYANLDQKLSSDFWKYPETLYHATDCDNIDGILKEGLHSSRGSGISNRGVFGVFTSTEADGYIDSYWDCKVAIDTRSMKRDGNSFVVEREPEIFDYILSQAISHRYGINVEREPEGGGGMDYNTWIVNGNVPPKYISRVGD